MSDKWEELLNKFIRLGGIAENICQREGAFGRGIFSVNSNLRSRIHVPSNLLFIKEDICLEGDKLRLTKDKNYSQEIRDFFDFYQDNFSWGEGGKEETEAFENGLSLFSSSLKKLIREYLLVDIEERHKGKWIEVIKKQFLQARTVVFSNKLVIAPVWELVNHDVISLPFIRSLEGLSTPNYPPIKGEIKFSYNSMGSHQRFFKYGFFSDESIVFSLPLLIRLKDSDVQIYCKGMDINNEKIIIERSNNNIYIKGIPIADLNYTSLPIHYFDQIMQQLSNYKIPKDTLSKIIELNVLIRKNIIKEINNLDDKVSKMFIKVINHELNLISSCN